MRQQMGRIQHRDGMSMHGKVEMFVTQGKPRLDLLDVTHGRGGIKFAKKCDIIYEPSQLIRQETMHNIIVNTGKDKVITALVQGQIHQIGRMAIGDRGAFPSDLTQPKTPTEDMTELYNEIYRGDVDAVIPNVGLPGVHEVQFVKTFEAVLIPITAFSNQATSIINEVALITFDETQGPLPRPPIIAPATPQADESMFSIRTFKSVPFEVANEISVTIRYTIFIA